MQFHGLFIGIDEYASPAVPNLTCTSRDAQALFGLFADTMGDKNAALLINQEATRQRILSEFEDRLFKSDPEDAVVIYFSGHGSDDHYLVTHDADPLNFDTTSIHLDELTSIFSEIPARNLLLVLDCCFAGGAGAKVFHPGFAKKAAQPSTNILEKMSGDGRVIFAAAGSDQEAIEDRRCGHSLFTYHLIEALKGAPEIVSNGRIPLFAMVNFVTQRVTEAARQIRHDQVPSFRGAVDGEFTFPVFKKGTIYGGFFPEQIKRKISGNISDLLDYGYPEELLAVWQNSFQELNLLQQTAINDFGLFEGNHLVVSAPTSSGKTMVGELAAIKAHLKRERTYFLLPLKALVSDKYDEFNKKYGAFGLKIIQSTGDFSKDNEALLRGKFDIALLTYERFSALTLTNPHLLRQVGLVVVDEVQMITDRNRGSNLELLITLLRTQRRIGIEPQILALSGVIGNTNGLEDWLSGRLLRWEIRPVPIDEGIITHDGTFRYITESGEVTEIPRYIVPEYRKGSSQDIIVPLVRKLTQDNEKIIVFRETKPVVRATARYLSQSLGLPPAQSTIDALPAGDPSTASELLKVCLRGGVAFHNADLSRDERQIIEKDFRDPASGLKVLVSTTTLAMGVNTPAWSVVIAGLEHPDGPYTVAEYKNMVGRAGRWGFTPKGKAFLVATSVAERIQLWDGYVTQKPEDLYSRFGESDPHSVICRVLAVAAAGRVPSLTEEQLFEFIEESFAAYQSRKTMGRTPWDRATLAQALQQLNSHALVEETSGHYSLTPLGRIAGESGIEVVSVIRVVEALRGLPADSVSEMVILALTQLTRELDDVIFPIHKKSHQERSRWQGALSQFGLPSQVIRTLRSTTKDEADYTCRCKRLAAVLLWIDGIEMSQIEASLLRHLPEENAAGPIRGVAERTRDLLEPVLKIAEALSGETIELQDKIDNLDVRLELGIAKDMVWLAAETGGSLNRRDYRLLLQQNITSLAALSEKSDDDLIQLLGTKEKLDIVREAEKSLQQKESVAEDLLPMPRIPF